MADVQVFIANISNSSYPGGRLGARPGSQCRVAGARRRVPEPDRRSDGPRPHSSAPAEASRSSVLTARVCPMPRSPPRAGSCPARTPNSPAQPSRSGSTELDFVKGLGLCNTPQTKDKDQHQLLINGSRCSRLALVVGEDESQAHRDVLPATPGERLRPAGAEGACPSP